MPARLVEAGVHRPPELGLDLDPDHERGDERRARQAALARPGPARRAGPGADGWPDSDWLEVVVVERVRRGAVGEGRVLHRRRGAACPRWWPPRARADARSGRGPGSAVTSTEPASVTPSVSRMARRAARTAASGSLLERLGRRVGGQLLDDRHPALMRRAHARFLPFGVAARDRTSRAREPHARAKRPPARTPRPAVLQCARTGRITERTLFPASARLAQAGAMSRTPSCPSRTRSATGSASSPSVAPRRATPGAPISTRASPSLRGHGGRRRDPLRHPDRRRQRRRLLRRGQPQESARPTRMESPAEFIKSIARRKNRRSRSSETSRSRSSAR